MQSMQRCIVLTSSLQFWPSSIRKEIKKWVCAHRSLCWWCYPNI
jgi:hypothetical protein